MEITKGQIHFVKKGISRCIVAHESNNFRYICIGYIPNENYESISGILNYLKSVNTFIATDSGNIRILSEMLINESYTKEYNSDVMINSYMVQILTEIYRLCNGNKKNEGNKYQNTYSGLAIYHALRYIDRNYSEINNIKEISEKLSYSEYYLAHIFKEKVGVTIKQYITEKKIAEAYNLIKNSNLSITEISDKLGYHNPTFFFTEF